MTFGLHRQMVVRGPTTCLNCHHTPGPRLRQLFLHHRLMLHSLINSLRLALAAMPVVAILFRVLETEVEMVHTITVGRGEVLDQPIRLVGGC